MMSLNANNVDSTNIFINCPVCNKIYNINILEEHLHKCLHYEEKKDVCHLKRKDSDSSPPPDKRPKFSQKLKESDFSKSTKIINTENDIKGLPLAESLRPIKLNDIIGHKDIFGSATMLHSLLEQKKIPKMILCGPPGCGKTSLANVISNICKEQNNMKFVKVSATMAGVNDVKEVVKIAKNEMQFKRQLFMDEIHGYILEEQSLQWLAEVSDGDARIALGALELVLNASNPGSEFNRASLAIITLDDIKESIVTRSRSSESTARSYLRDDALLPRTPASSGPAVEQTRKQRPFSGPNDVNSMSIADICYAY